MIIWLMIGLRAIGPLAQPKVLKVEKFTVLSTSTLTFCPKTAYVLFNRTAATKTMDRFIYRTSIR